MTMDTTITTKKKKTKPPNRDLRIEERVLETCEWEQQKKGELEVSGNCIYSPTLDYCHLAEGLSPASF